MKKVEKVEAGIFLVPSGFDDLGSYIGKLIHHIDDLVEAVEELQDIVFRRVEGAHDIALLRTLRKPEEPRYTVTEMRKKAREYHDQYPQGSGAYTIQELRFLDWLEEKGGA